jgi:hypothetical protein
VLHECLLALLLASGGPSQAASDAARAELEACAVRIEELKARGETGAELERLLWRSAELASKLEGARADAGPAASVPGADELRERADAARDEADRLAAELAAVDVKLQDARRGDDSVQRAAVGGAPSGAEARIRALHATRAELAARRARALAEADRLEHEAKAAEYEP